MTTLDQLLAKQEAFCKALGDVEGLEVEVTPVAAAKDADIAAVERATKAPVPADLRALWKRGFNNVRICDADYRVLAAAKLVSAKGALQQIKIAHELVNGKYPPKEPEMVRWLKHGIPLQEEESYGFVDASDEGRGSVRQMRFDGDPIETAIAQSFTSFYEQWLASGCFSYGNADAAVFNAYWKKVSDLVPVKIEPAKNGWLKHMGRYYENAKFPKG